MKSVKIKHHMNQIIMAELLERMWTNTFQNSLQIYFGKREGGIKNKSKIK